MIGGMAVKKKIVALVLALILSLSCVSFAFAAEDDSYSIISPQTSETGITYCDNLLISVKTTDNTALRFTLYSYPNYTSVKSIDLVPASVFNVRSQFGPSEDYVGGDGVSFYTRQVNNIEAGMYGLKIEKFDEEGNVISVNQKYFIIESSASKDSAAIYESQTSANRVMFFQNVFRNLFGTTVVDVSE